MFCDSFLWFCCDCSKWSFIGALCGCEQPVGRGRPADTATERTCVWARPQPHRCRHRHLRGARLESTGRVRGKGRGFGVGMQACRRVCTNQLTCSLACGTKQPPCWGQVLLSNSLDPPLASRHRQTGSRVFLCRPQSLCMSLFGCRCHNSTAQHMIAFSRAFALLLIVKRTCCGPSLPTYLGLPAGLVSLLALPACPSQLAGGETTFF